MLLRDASLVRVEEGDGPKRRTSPVHAEQARMCEESVHTTNNPLHSHPCTPGTGEQQQSLGRAYKVTLGGTNARVQRCQTRHHPIAAMQAGPPGPTFAGQTSIELSACRSIPARNLLRVPGVHLNQATAELCICGIVECCCPCLLLSLSTSFHPSALSLLSIAPLHPHRTRHISPAGRLF